MRISENALLVFETDDDTKFMHSGMDPDYKVRGPYLNTLGILERTLLTIEDGRRIQISIRCRVSA
jgi:hypothetical protein